MSRPDESVTAGVEDGRTTELARVTRVARVGDVVDATPVAPRTLAGLLALVPVGGATLFRVAHNAPGALPPTVVDLAAVVLPLAVAGPALAALLLAAVAGSESERLGLAFVGGFGLVALAGGTAWFPAAVGVCAGCGALLGGHVRGLGRGVDATAVRRGVVYTLLVAGVVASLAATAGVAAGTLRPVGSGVALLGVGLTPAVGSTDRLDLLVGVAAGLLTVAVATSIPYVAGAVLLVGGGVVGVPLGLVALAVGGGVATLVGGLRRAVGGVTDADGTERSVVASTAVAAALLLVAGVPGTLLRAVGVAVAVGLLVGGESA